MAAVGKTSIIRKFLDPTKQITTTSGMTTIGVDFYTYYLTFMDAPIKVKIYDTAGQERFGPLTTNYLKNLDGVILVFSFDSPDSLKQTCTWRKHLYETKEIPYTLVGNKCDLPGKDELLSECRKTQSDLQCSYSECSALTGEGIQNSILSQIYECLKPVENFVMKFKEEM